MARPLQSRWHAFLAWLNGLPDLQFTTTLYMLRWAIIGPLALLLSPIAGSADTIHATSDAWGYFIPLLIVAPVFETFVECTLPYSLMYGLLNLRPQSAFLFVFVSATVMVLLHPLTPVVIIFAYITGSFLGYVYAHFALQSQFKAFLHTALFHAAINLVGWIGILTQM